MKQIQRFILVVSLIVISAGITNGQVSQLEDIDRGLIAVAVPDSGIYLGWRLLASDPDSIKFNIYRGFDKVNDEPVEASTNLLDPNGTVNDKYSIIKVIGGVEQGDVMEVIPWEQNYKTIPLQKPVGGQTPDGVNYEYTANDASAADLDGDGEYDIVLKWDPTNSKDNSQSGHTGNVFLDGLKMDGTLLWRIDLGKNIRAGAHYTQFMVYDLDGDGKAEVACKTADATIDGKGSVIGDVNADYRNSDGRVLSGPEYFTIFSGETGEALATTDYLPARGNVGAWGDSYGNRVDRFLAGVAYLDGEKPSVVMCRGYYTRTVLAAWDWRENQLTNRWIFDTNNGYSGYASQGNHQLSVADLDEDGKDEIIYGSMSVDDDGTGLWNSGLGHGDALHVSDIDPTIPGLEIWGIHEHANVGSALLKGKTGEIIWSTGPGDVGRGVSANLDDSQEGMECWGGTDGLRSAKNVNLGNYPPSSNHVIWWDGDLERELLDDINIRKYGGSNRILLLASGCSSNNYTKANPCLQADLFGDWREEVIWRSSDNSSLRIYTTNIKSPHRLVTLMHDRQYRTAIAWQNVGYNQPPHTSYFIGRSMLIPDSLRPPSTPRNVRTISWGDTVKLTWDANVDTDLAGYIIYRSENETDFTDSFDVGNITSYIDTDVINDTTYYYAISAYDLNGNKSDFTETLMAIPTVRPDTPSGISYRHNSNVIFLIWEYQDIDQLSKFTIYRSENSDMSSAVSVTLDKSINNYSDIYTIGGKSYFYTISATDTNNTESFPSDVLQITPGPSFTFQSENASFIGAVFLEDNHLGFNGAGFTNFDGNNSSVEFTHMPGYGGGNRTLIFRYALGSDDRTGSLIVNGETQSLTMKGSNEWTNYITDSVEVNLNNGFDNIIRFSSTGSDFGNLDEITIVPRSITGIESEENNSTTEYRLIQNYPNPFNPTTTITYSIPKSGEVTLRVYDILGEVVKTLVNAERQAGTYKANFNGDDLSSGIYFYRLQTNNKILIKKMLLLK